MGTGGLRAIVCDDAVGYRLMASALLRDAGFDVVAEAATAAAGFEAAGEHRPDVVLWDHLLPDGGDTAAALERLRGLAPEARIVLVSGLPIEQLRRVADEAGADATLHKGSSPEELAAVVAGALGERRPQA